MGFTLMSDNVGSKGEIYDEKLSGSLERQAILFIMTKPGSV